VTAVRSALFFIWFILISVVIHLGALPLLLTSRHGVMIASRTWSRLVLWGAKWIAGMRYEVRGREYIPTGAALVAAKHQSMWETLILVLLLREPAVVLKRELIDLPFYGWLVRP
jgi:1-acyl-sn-glycerol-3-phosphate acyltransferase